MTPRMSLRRSAFLLAALLAAAFVPDGLRAQQDSLPGVRLGLVYETTYIPPLAVKPFTGRFGGQAAAPQVEAIISRDLRNSDRFEVMDELPRSMGREGVEYSLWDRMGAVWLLTGTVEGSGNGWTKKAIRVSSTPTTSSTAP